MSVTLAPLGALDTARRALFRASGPLARWLLVDRESRVATFGCVGLVVAFALALACPGWAIGVGTVVLGVPHVVSDVRYLVVRRGLARRASLYAGVLVAVVGTPLGFGLRAAVVGAAVAVAFARASVARRAGVLFGLSLAFALAWVYRGLAELAYLHAHNLIALGFFALFARRMRGAVWLPLAFFVVLAAFLLGPYALPALTWTGALTRAPVGLDLTTLVSQLAPTVDSSWAVRGVAFFAFAQAAHYVVWLRLVPELERPSPRPRSFRQSWRAIVRELSPYAVAFFVLGTVVFVGWGLRDLAGARIAYLQSAFFHGYLELAVLALFAAEGSPQPPIDAPARVAA
ncbi:MAG: hypothetical protein IPF92_22325 [Myxococcales bacterium]|nr:hypothetical protein [Myxococcales bacterium]MBL0194579.1 hypothetical protein [Myxococcales bacterium]HQY63306.1 hypothetical protein [Polyangiaceae bacterium]